MQRAAGIKSVSDPRLEVAGLGSASLPAASHPWMQLGMGMELGMDPRMEMETRMGLGMRLGIHGETSPLIYSAMSGT